MANFLGGEAQSRIIIPLISVVWLHSNPLSWSLSEGEGGMEVGVRAGGGGGWGGVGPGRVIDLGGLTVQSGTTLCHVLSNLECHISPGTKLKLKVSPRPQEVAFSTKCDGRSL